MTYSKIKATGDGNCLPNAAAILLCLLANQLKEDFNHKQNYQRFLEILLANNPDIATKANLNPGEGFITFERFLQEVTTWKEKERRMAPAIRAYAAECVEKNQEAKVGIQNTFIAAFREYCASQFKIKLQETKFAGDDIFNFEAIQDKFSSLFKKYKDFAEVWVKNPAVLLDPTNDKDAPQQEISNDSNSTQQQLNNELNNQRFELCIALNEYWNDTGFNTYIQHIKKNSVSIGDIEISAVARALDLNLSVFKLTNSIEENIIPASTEVFSLVDDFSNRPTLTLLHTPGHWDIAATQEQAKQYNKFNKKPSVNNEIKLDDKTIEKTINQDVNDIFDKLDTKRTMLGEEEVKRIFNSVFDEGIKIYQELKNTQQDQRFALFKTYQQKKSAFLAEIDKKVTTTKSASCSTEAGTEGGTSASQVPLLNKA